MSYQRVMIYDSRQVYPEGAVTEGRPPFSKLDLKEANPEDIYIYDGEYCGYAVDLEEFHIVRIKGGEGPYGWHAKITVVDGEVRVY